MRTECKSCEHREEEDFCSKDNNMEQDDFTMCKKYKCDFSLRKDISVVSDAKGFSARFVERRSRFGGVLKIEDACTDFEKFLADGGGWSLNPKHSGKAKLVIKK